MRKYVVKWFPERQIFGRTLCFGISKSSKTWFLTGFGFTLISITFGLLPLFGVGVLGFGNIFNITINGILLFYYVFMLVKIKKNDMGNGVPDVW